VAISLIAVACSRDPDACWLAAAWSSADELCTWPTAPLIWRPTDRVIAQPIAATTMTPAKLPHRMIAMVHCALDLVSAVRCLIRSDSCWSS
jgi:hypothetical protein